MVRLTIEGLRVELAGRAVLDDLNLSLVGGGLIGLIGPNGAGKSTLVRAIAGVAPHDGHIRLDGRDLASMSRRERARAVAWLPQGQAVHWPVRVERLVALGRLPHLGPLTRASTEDAAAVERAMARADVLHLRERIVTELSGGEYARVLLARALAVEARVLLVDEPLAALDPLHQIEVMELLSSCAEQGQLVIAVLHDLTMAARFCTRLAMLDRGRLVAAGAPDEVLTVMRLAEVYGIAARLELRDGFPVVQAIGRAQPTT